MIKFKFMCHKCENEIVLTFAKDNDIALIAEQLHSVTMSDCPFCGEEPYENWILKEVDRGHDRV